MIKCVPVVVEEAKGSFSLAGARVSILGLIRAMAAEEVMAARLLEADHDVVVLRQAQQPEGRPWRLL
jgi:hypothetical protein